MAVTVVREITKLSTTNVGVNLNSILICFRGEIEGREASYPNEECDNINNQDGTLGEDVVFSYCP